jgi:hypothetical protein
MGCERMEVGDGRSGRWVRWGWDVGCEVWEVGGEREGERKELGGRWEE